MKSATSLILLLSVPAGYGFKLVSPVRDASVQLNRFLNLTFIICLAGIAQYAAQRVIGVRYAYPIEHFTPPNFVTHEYHTLIPLKFGSSTYKANGVVPLKYDFMASFAWQNVSGPSYGANYAASAGFTT